MTDSTHLIWTEQILKILDDPDIDEGLRLETIIRAKDAFNAYTPNEKADIFIALLGRNRNSQRND